MSRGLVQVVREVCLAPPESEETSSHGMANFRVRGKTFATLAVNHHGDGRVALWLPCTAEYRGVLVDADAESYFVPPYVGPRGWLGVRLDRALPGAALLI